MKRITRKLLACLLMIGFLAGSLWTSGSTARADEASEDVISITYNTHVQTYAWFNTPATDGEFSGTHGKAKRMEAIIINVTKNGEPLTGCLRYRAHVQTFGWQDWVTDGEMCGTTGLAKRLEGIQIELTGELAEKYDVYYRVHGQTYGWLGWAKNGTCAGSEGRAKRLEGIQIVIVKKGTTPYVPTYDALAGIDTNAVLTLDYSFVSPNGNTPSALNVDGTPTEYNDITVPDNNSVPQSGSAAGQDIVEYARQYKGIVPYVYAGTSLTEGTDCSGFVRLIYAAKGITLPGNDSWEDPDVYKNIGTLVGTDPAMAQPGDLVVTSGHAAIATGNSNAISQLNSRQSVQEHPIRSDYMNGSDWVIIRPFLLSK